MLTRFFLASFFLFVFSVSSALACGCGGGSDDRTPAEKWKSIIESSTAVFTGKVIGFVYRKGGYDEWFEQHRIRENKPWLEYEVKFVRFKVDRWWAGDLTEEVELITDEKRTNDGSTSFSSCDYNFKEGETYIVVAYNRGIHLATHSCTATAPIKDTKPLVQLIGEGKMPVKRRDN